MIAALAVADGIGDLSGARLRRLPSRSRYRREVQHVVLKEPEPELYFDFDSVADPNRVRELHEIIASLDTLTPHPMTYNPFLAPLTFTGYMVPPAPKLQFVFSPTAAVQYADTLEVPDNTEELAEQMSPDLPDHDILRRRVTQMQQAADMSRHVAWLRHKYMVEHPRDIEYAEWLLPLPPELPDDDNSFRNYINRLHLPSVNTQAAHLRQRVVEHIDWLHVFRGGVQFSQAYLSHNWYQGGNDYLALLINFYWNVKLNEAYHPNVLFDNTISYKLGLNSTQQDQYHDYSISEDLFQWNMNFGLKARKSWYYSLTAQFKTQILNNYPQNSLTRTASFLSPGELTVGLGMTHTSANKKKTLKFKAALSPLSYNFKMCPDHDVDPTQFGIPAGHTIHNEIGSSAELTLDWQWTSNISWRSRMFVFSDYQQYHHDWENTFSFSINRFLSTQIYAHLRYDTTSATAGSKWGHWMMKEILSFGFSYAFSTK